MRPRFSNAIRSARALTDQHSNKIQLIAKFCTAQSQSLEGLLELFAQKAESDVGPFRTTITPSYPLLEYVAAAAGLQFEASPNRLIYLSIEKNIVPDLELARARLAPLLSPESSEAFPDWKGDDLFTVVRLQSVPEAALYVEQAPSIVVELAIRADGTLEESSVYSAVTPEHVSANTIVSPKGANLNRNDVLPLLQIVASQLEERDLPPPRP